MPTGPGKGCPSSKLLTRWRGQACCQESETSDVDGQGQAGQHCGSLRKLAAGGAGVSGGMAMLGGIVAVPLVAIASFGTHKKAREIEAENSDAAVP